jgi:tetratricopeptide (TPR) repeat protein
LHTNVLIYVAIKLGYVRLQRSDCRRSAEAFEMCLKKKKERTVAQLNLALAYRKVGDRDLAQLVYEQALNSDPKSLDAVRGLAALALERDDLRLGGAGARARRPPAWRRWSS